MNTERFYRIISAPTFLDKFIAREFHNAGYKEAPSGSDATEIFVATPACPDTPVGVRPLVVVRPEGAFTAPATSSPSVTTILTPYIIGTGMDGLMRELAAITARGMMIHIRDNEARVSVIHAADVARATFLLASHPGTYVITDGTDPTWTSLIEALSTRVGHKRISTLSPTVARRLAWIVKFTGGPDRRIIDTITTDSTVSPTPLPVDFTPVDTVHYLKTHRYTDEDL